MEDGESNSFFNNPCNDGVDVAVVVVVVLPVLVVVIVGVGVIEVLASVLFVADCDFNDPDLSLLHLN
ncbi:hypothetical protein WICMUC_005167 [Wickerhamomyces mucosus]|uniref:Transmembrane protein n=1 Tax=Wickerhamomyces mucosus TaxID=1378264 RepID=A0A9P8PAV7_9ASCO|nr:hypothetical protein WICMUC_005167 [Wickerhamomyces mucosus]